MVITHHLYTNPSLLCNIMAVQLQWGLDNTAFSTLRNARSLIHAASTDNIQPKAILACEGFGATIAICQETCRKIESTVIPVPQPTSLSFIAGFIGYSAGDCVSELSKSLAGLQFLALAAAVVTTLPMHQAGDLIASMLVNSAADRTLVPSRRQTTDLLKSIEGRCYRAAFADDVYNWHILLEKIIQEKLNGAGRLWARSTRAHPGITGIKSLVDAFRQLYRVGESHIARLTVRTTSAAPWTIAFVKWCLGRPPSIVLENGTSILDQAGSKVELVVSQEDSTMFEVKLYSSVPSLSTLVKTQVDYQMVGMIRVASYGKLLLREYDLDGDFPTQVIDALVSVGIHQILQNLVVLGDTRDLNKGSGRRYLHGLSISAAGLHSRRFCPFPDENAISETCHDLLGREVPTKMQPLPEGLTIFDLPLSKLHIDNLRAKCPCAECSPDKESRRECLADAFARAITILLATVLVMSLFDGRDSLLVTASTSIGMGYSNSLAKAIRTILAQNSTSTCEVSEILDWAQWLVCHGEVRIDGNDWVMSCHKDQTLWPKLYDMTSISGRGYLSLFWLPGKLHFQNDTYDLVVSKASNWVALGSERHKIATAEPVSGPCNLFSGVTSHWQITPQDRVLEASIMINGPSGKYNSPWIFSNPCQAIRSIAEALWVDGCCHARNAQLAAPDPFCMFIDPFRKSSIEDPSIEDSNSEESSGEEYRPRHGEHSVPGMIQVIAMDRSDNLRFAALGMNRNNIPAVLRGTACLDCCLKVCRQAGFPMLIL